MAAAACVRMSEAQLEFYIKENNGVRCSRQIRKVAFRNNGLCELSKREVMASSDYSWSL